MSRMGVLGPLIHAPMRWLLIGVHSSFGTLDSSRPVASAKPPCATDASASVKDRRIDPTSLTERGRSHRSDVPYSTTVDALSCACRIRGTCTWPVMYPRKKTACTH
jgi:hypothetical protein